MEQETDDRSGIGGRTWNDAPEVRAARHPKAEPTKAAGSELEDARFETAYLQNALAEVGEAAGEAYEQVLDSMAYFTDFDSFENPVEIADQLLASNDPDRLEWFSAQWAERDPLTFEAWRIQRQREATAAFAAETHTEIERLRAEQGHGRAKVAAEFAAEKDDLLGEALAETAYQSTANPEELKQSLSEAYAIGEKAEKARLQSEAVRSVRDAFRDPSAMGTRALDRKTGERREAPPEVSLDEIQARMTPPAEYVQAQREENLNSFREQFSAAARGSGVGEGNREGAARAVKARDQELMKPKIHRRREY